MTINIVSGVLAGVWYTEPQPVAAEEGTEEPSADSEWAYGLPEGYPEPLQVYGADVFVTGDRHG